MYTLSPDTAPTVDNIKEAIKYNLTYKDHFNHLYRYYMGEHEILGRLKVDTLKNNKVVINHAKYITSINVGYLLGNPVDYNFSPSEDSDKNQNNKLDPVLDQYKKQTITDLDHEIATKVSILGKAYEYDYLVENDVHSKCIDPRNCIIVYDNTMEHKKLFGILYGECDPQKEKYEDVTVVTQSQIIEYTEDLKVVYESKPHQFGNVPLIEYVNNPEHKGDFEDVITLIDAYNILQSDRINDKEQLVDAILMLYGFTLTKEQVTSLKEHRIMSAPAKEGGSSAEYLIKQLNETDADVLRQVIEADIHKISMTPNLSDKEFVGNSSGVAIRYKLLAFEQSILNKERYFEKGLLERFELYNNYLKAISKMQIIPVYQVDVVFKRNLPQNDLETSQTINNLSELITKETLIGQVSFVDDASKELEAKEAENKQETQLGAFGTDQPSPADLEKQVNVKTDQKKNGIVEQIKSLLS